MKDAYLELRDQLQSLERNNDIDTETYNTLLDLVTRMHSESYSRGRSEGVRISLGSI